MSIGVGMKVKGAKAVASGISKAAKAYPEATAAAIYQKGLQIIGDAVLITPVEFGRLRASAFAAPPRRIFSPIVRVGFATDYAVFVHERTELQHNPPGRAKFLKIALGNHRRGYPKWIAKKTEENFKRGVKIGSVKAGPIAKSEQSGQTKGLKAFQKRSASKQRKK